MGSFKRSDYSTLVNLFLKEPKKISYPKEYAIAKKLLSSYGDFAFWKSDTLHSKRSVLNSLAYFLTEDGKAFLEDGFSCYKKIQKLDKNCFKNEPHDLKKTKVGKSLNLKTKKRISLLDFIEDAEEKEN